jgi:HK97 family phage major capsid protein
MGEDQQTAEAVEPRRISIEDLRARVDETKTMIGAMSNEMASRAPTDDDIAKWNEMNVSFEADKKELADREAMLLRAKEVLESGDEKRVEHGASFHVGNTKRVEDIFDIPAIERATPAPGDRAAKFQDHAMRAVQNVTFQHPDADEEASKARLERVVKADADGNAAQYILATGSATYKRAFGKVLSGKQTTSEEANALERAQSLERAMSLTGASGGFGVPFDLDPTMLLTNAGVVNPIRQIARVIPTTRDEWRGITTAGITASYAAEATETTDNAPTLVQPTVSTEKAQAFVPFSIEVGMDWSGSLQADLAVALQDAKDVLEADKFVNGSGTNEPFGVLTGTTTTVAAATGLTFTLANLYALVGALPPRYRANASILMNYLTINRIRQFDTVGSQTAVWQNGLQAGAPDRLLGLPAYEASAVTGTITNAVKFAVIGDFSRYVILDRIGLSIELIPHLLGANRRPTGERGLYAYWRNGAKVIDANAFRGIVGTT